MTLKEAILKSLEEVKTSMYYMDVFEHISKNHYFDFKGAKTPSDSVASTLGDFIRKSDTRVKRVKNANKMYVYYLAKFEETLDLDSITSESQTKIIKTVKDIRPNTYEERDLHKLLSSFLKNNDTYSKTIFHEQSNRNDEHQKWIHPDMVGIKFLKLQNPASQAFLKTINKVDTFKLSSYEIKREINTDYELKKYFFQAVSNSSWANFGYLVALEINENLMDEIERLNLSFGIGIIQLKPNPYESKILFQSRNRDLEFKTIDKLCKIHKEFVRFIEQVEKILNANERYVSSTEKELDEFCDEYFSTDTEFEQYCVEKHIPIEIRND